MDVKSAIWTIATITTALLLAACSKSDTAPAPPPAPPAPSTATFTVTFGENPVPFRSTGCNSSMPQGWYTTARIQETAGVAFTPSTLTQKLDGAAASVLSESFASRFGACSGSAMQSSNPKPMAALFIVDSCKLRAPGAVCRRVKSLRRRLSTVPFIIVQ